MLRSHWLKYAGVAVTAAACGYGVAKINVPLTECPPSPGGAIFPPSLFSVHAATALPATREADVAPGPRNGQRIAQIMRHGFPSLSNVRSFEDYVLSFDTRTRVPSWVFEHLTEQSVAKNDDVDRQKCQFTEDKSFHEYFRPSNQDYKYSGFDRGHMAAAANHRLSQSIIAQTFTLSNIAPQVGKGFNRDKWNELEMYVRRLARKYAHVYVCTGPLFVPRQEQDGHLYVHYRVLGAGHVAVPTHFFKVVVTESASGEFALETFLLPNAVIDDGVKLGAFHVPLEVVERSSGLLFFDKIDKSIFKHVNGNKTGWL